ncbi:MAG: (Fe-S)-binding protein [Pseudomonadota bacterium]
MEFALISPAKASFLLIPSVLFSILIPVAGIALLTYILAKRLPPLFRAAPDFRFDNIPQRLWNMYHYPHDRMPRYKLSGAIHITTLICLIVLSLRFITTVLSGISEGYTLPGFTGVLGTVYTILKDYAETILFGVCIVAIIRRAYFKPGRYDVPERYAKERTSQTAMYEAVLYPAVMAMIAVMDMLYAGSLTAASHQKGVVAALVAPGSGPWVVAGALSGSSLPALQAVHITSYYVFSLLLFSFICLLPFGRLFHLITAAPNVFFKKLKKGTVKPVKWGITDEQVEELESLGVKKFEDFTWKHMLDFYACADCGRCSDQCPANAVGRPLSPRFISIKGREYMFKNYPLKGDFERKTESLIGTVYEEDEIWSCTTCGACEEECPVTIEYIDKIVDLRRGMVDEGMVPQSLQKPLSALEKRGNPYGKMEKKRSEWTKEIEAEVPVKLVGQKGTAETLFFVDSVTSFDDQIFDIGRATARVLHAAGADFGILGPLEKDSGHEVRRFGEETLFMSLREQNTEAILASGAKEIVTADPHALNALKNDYKDLPPVLHISEFIARSLKEGKIQLKSEEMGKVYTYHDPCYLGRHNKLYDIPRDVLDAIPGLKRVEMEKYRDRSFCCGGGGLMLFYEPIEETRMGSLRVAMANKAGADVIVTACPFCMINIADAIKTSGLEGKMEVIDLVQLVNRHLVPKL